MLKVFHVDFMGNWIVLGILLFLTAIIPTLFLLPVLYFVLNVFVVRNELEEKDYKGLRAACKEKWNLPSWLEPPRF